MPKPSVCLVALCCVPETLAPGLVGLPMLVLAIFVALVGRLTGTPERQATVFVFPTVPTISTPWRAGILVHNHLRRDTFPTSLEKRKILLHCFHIGLDFVGGMSILYSS